MKDIDFLPEWYKESHRRRMHMRHQYAVLAGLVCAMILYNLVAIHRISAASAGIDRLDDQRRVAEQVIYEYDAVNAQLRDRQAKVDLVSQMDSKIDVGAVLAELSHLISGNVVLSRLEFISEPLASTRDQTAGGTAVRLAGGSSAGQSAPLGNVCFRIVMAGVAAKPDDVGILARRLETSRYFKQVYPSVSRSSRIERTGSAATPSSNSQDGATAGPAKEAVQVSEFEITCYLANYEEVKGK